MGCFPFVFCPYQCIAAENILMHFNTSMLCLSWASGRGLLEVYWGWTDAASAGDQEEVY